MGIEEPEFPFELEETGEYDDESGDEKGEGEEDEEDEEDDEEEEEEEESKHDQDKDGGGDSQSDILQGYHYPPAEPPALDQWQANTSI